MLVRIAACSGEQRVISLQRCNVDEGYAVYELLASVAHIRDPKSGGNLVAHINVGETYHQRKEGVTTTQFYLFNDFSIIDIEKVTRHRTFQSIRGAVVL